MGLCLGSEWSFEIEPLRAFKSEQSREIIVPKQEYSVSPLSLCDLSLRFPVASFTVLDGHSFGRFRFFEKFRPMR